MMTMLYDKDYQKNKEYVVVKDEEVKDYLKKGWKMSFVEEVKEKSIKELKDVKKELTKIKEELESGEKL